MWSILKIYIGLTLLAINVHGIELDIKDVIKKRQLIDGIFRPISAKKIGDGGFSTIYKGVNMIDNSDVALKFSYQKEESKHEYEIYTYLNATNNSKVERFGISPIYYYNEYGNVTLTVFPLFEIDLYRKHKLKVRFQTIDCLILLRDFVRQSKYIHSRGIRHDDIKQGNIMLRKSRSFLIDFNLSSKMNESRNRGSIHSASRKHHQHRTNKEPLKENEMRRPIDDWESFLYTIASFANVKFEWYDLEKYRVYDLEMLAELVKPMKDDTKKSIEQITKDVKCKHLKKVMVEFAQEAFKEDGSLPRYNYFEKLITDEINDVIGNGQPAIFSWLEGNERDEAINDLKNNPPATAEEIDDPKDTFDYKTPDYTFFDVHRDEMTNKAYENYQRYLKEEDEKDRQKELEDLKIVAEKEKIKKKVEKSANLKKILSKCILRKEH